MFRLSILLLLLLVSPAGAQADELPGVKAESKQWILVCAKDLRTASEPLIQHRKQQGWEVVVVDAARYTTSTDQKPQGSEQLLKDLNQQTDGFSGTTCIVFMGCWAGPPSSRAATLAGTQLRMKQGWTDHRFGQPTDDGTATISVGRLPARSPQQVKVMIDKIIRFEGWTPVQNDVHLIVAHPGGNSDFERTIATNIVRTAVDKRLKLVNQLWQPKCVMDLPGTEFTVPSLEFGRRTQQLFEKPHVFSVYSGHSMANGLYSEAGCVFSGEQFANLKPKGPVGVLVSCGCYGCQIEGPRGQGYGLAAIRSIAGPVAVIGSVSESYSAMGLLAFDGLLTQLQRDEPPHTLGAYWLAVLKGVTRGQIPPTEFMMHDMADGSRGKVPLAKQRLEHAEMWTLLGDPALRIPTQGIPAAGKVDIQNNGKQQ